MLASLIYGMPNLNWAEPKDHTELFSGCASVTRGEMQEGRSVFAYDIVYNSEFMDIMTPQGFALAIYAVLNTKRAASGHGEILDELDKFKPLRTPVREKHELVEKYVDGKGKSRIKGSSNLKSSQAYPLQLFALFGRALARLRTRRMKDIKKTSKAFVKQSPQSVAKKRTGSLSVWIDMANLQPVFDYLS
ncbi:unnamed protein product [Durusdinium trenchii]|uniref:Uncharacterized protein n=1 Tax=Durusdinium trenchii TaxID=1381693 RepID=A0ABP0IAY2_9DINO